MRVVALISGGKDSCFNLLQCVAAGHEIIALANLQPNKTDELDSYMYQTVGHDGISKLAEALGLPLYRRLIQGNAILQDKDYSLTEGDEVEDLFALISQIKSEIDFDAISVGAILSDYQRIRVENVCTRLGLVSLAYLWRRNQSELLQEMIDCGMHAIIIKTASLGLDPDKHLGKTIQEMQKHLTEAKEKYGINVCGEGGEYETFTLDCPLFRQTIVIDESERVMHSNDAFAPVGYLKFKKLHLVQKTVNLGMSQKEMILGLPSNKTPTDFLSDLIECKEADCCDGRIEICKKNSNNENTPTTISTNDKNNIAEKTTPIELLDASFDNLTISTNNDADADENENDDDNNLDKDEIQNFVHQCETLPLPNSVHSIINSGGWCWIMGIRGVGKNPMNDALENLKDELHKQDLQMESLIGVVLYIGDMRNYAQYNNDYIKFFSVNPPIRICIESPLPNDSPLLLEAIAFKTQPDNENCTRQCMHVQGISHWAPANIGPYSQAIWVGDIIYVAGQIGLVPGSMKLVEGGARIECKLALKHIDRILKATDSKAELRDVVQGVCYVTHPKYIESCRQEWEKRTNNSICEYLVVPKLPRDARVEWHIWAHKHNAAFEYEETGSFLGSGVKVRIIRRWNYENSCAAIVCRVLKVEEAFVIDTEKICETIEYAINKLLSDAEKSLKISLRVFYLIGAINPLIIHEALEKKASQYEMAFSLLPVSCLIQKQTIISFCGVRHM